MDSLVGLRHYENHKRRQRRLRRQRDGLTNNDRAFGDMSRQEVKDFLNRLLEIDGGRRRITRIQEGPAEQSKFYCAIREVKFNHYEGNIQMI